jgi:hypothetical protein
MYDTRTTPLESFVFPWIQLLPQINGNPQKVFMLSYGKLDADRRNQCLSIGVLDANIINVDSLANIGGWWPDMVRFIYNAQRQGIRVEGSDVCIWKNPDLDPKLMSTVAEMDNMFKKASLVIGETPEQSDNVLAIVNHDLCDQEREGIKNIQVMCDTERKHLHIIAPNKNAILAEGTDITTTVYGQDETMKCFLWILSDLRILGYRRPKQSPPKTCGEILKTILKVILFALGGLIGVPFALAYVSVMFSLIAAFFIFIILMYCVCGECIEKHSKKSVQPEH